MRALRPEHARLPVELCRRDGCEPLVYTMADVRSFAAMPEFAAWLKEQELV